MAIREDPVGMQMRMAANMRTWLIFDLPHPTPVQPAGADNAPQHMQLPACQGAEEAPDLGG